LIIPVTEVTVITIGVRVIVPEAIVGIAAPALPVIVQVLDELVAVPVRLADTQVFAGTVPAELVSIIPTTIPVLVLAVTVNVPFGPPSPFGAIDPVQVIAVPGAI
jgi:hypothetical protein